MKSRHVLGLMLGMVFALTVSASAQKHIDNYDPEALFNEGVLLFQNQEYGAALSVFTQYRAQAADAKSQRCVDAQYYEAVSSLYLGQADGPAKVVQFVNDNPGSTWAKHANFLYANNLFQEKKYKEALAIYEKADATSLSADEAQQMQFNMGYALIGKYLYLHMHDVIAGDIQLKNALIEDSAHQYLIDMDSVQIENLPCPVGTEDFTDPALWGKDFSGFVRTLKDEDYSIAMLVFSVLFCGLHPYATRNGAETLREEILNKNFPYTLDNSDTEHIPLGGYVHIWEYLPEYLRKMLYRTFKEGKSYEAVCWRDAVQQYMTELETFKYDDAEAYKLFPCEDYKQITIDVEEYRNKLAAQNDRAQKAAEPKPKIEKKQFDNVPSGRFVSSSVGTSSSFRPMRFDEDEKPAKTEAPAPIPTAAPKKKFFGLF